MSTAEGERVEAVHAYDPCSRATCLLRPHDHFGRRLRELREQSGLTQRELADQAEMAQPAVARLEGCTSIPTVATLKRLGRALGCDFSILIESDR
jgi:predicted transcriptional regulator